MPESLEQLIADNRALGEENMRLKARVAELEARHDTLEWIRTITERDRYREALELARTAMTAIKFSIDPNDICDDLIQIFDPAVEAVNDALDSRLIH